MKIKQFEIPGLAQYAYVVSSKGEAAVIDPMRDYERYLDYAASESLKVRFVTETHIHADFASGAVALAAACRAELLLSGHEEDEKYRYSMPHRSLRDGDEFVVGKARLRALHTPGHTPEHLSFVLFDEERD
ncbi:MAG: MBL fold metallo-hydrolase, partial [Terriglobus roseus]|nr:MBL fold metallo-hydrolase [Terriglobus roseus]